MPHTPKGWKHLPTSLSPDMVAHQGLLSLRVTNMLLNTDTLYPHAIDVMRVQFSHKTSCRKMQFLVSASCQDRDLRLNGGSQTPDLSGHWVAPGDVFPLEQPFPGAAHLLCMLRCAAPQFFLVILMHSSGNRPFPGRQPAVHAVVCGPTVFLVILMHSTQGIVHHSIS